MRTLIVEDDLTSQLLLRTFLSQYGPCDLAANGVEAVQAFGAALDRGAPYDLVCLDIMMPEMDGQTALMRIRELEKAAGGSWQQHVQIIMATALGDAGEVMKAFYGLCDAYLCKPIDTGALRDHLQTLRLVP